MKKAIQKLPLRKLIFWLSLFASLITIPILIYTIVFSGKIYPNIYVAGTNISGMTREEAIKILSETTKAPEEIKLTYQDQSFNLPAKDISPIFDFVASIERAYTFTRTGNVFLDIYERVHLLTAQKNIGLTTTLDKDKLTKFVSVVSGQISTDPIPPSVKIISGKAQITNGTSGTTVDSNLLTAQIGNHLSNADTSEIKIQTQEINAKLTESELADYQKRVDSVTGKGIEITFDARAGIYNSFKYSDKEIVNFIGPKGGFDESRIIKTVNEISSKTNRTPQNPKFSFSGGKVSEFLPSKDGVKVDGSALKGKIEEAVTKLGGYEQKTLILEAPYTLTPAEVSTGSVNDLGIKELVGRGTSTYFHSIPTRIHNVSLAASRINGTLVKPGETFSFNNALGDVSQFTGYQQAYIISGGKTILGDGGGVCQVSTTLFRALLNAGMPILERTSHSYRVGYYEQNSPPGLDATVYGPTPDLKFKNDTPNYILIMATADPRNLSMVFELYGTSDGRVATTSKPIVSNVSPAPPTVYQDDPALPTGKTKQIDFSASGARVIFNYSVERNGENIYKKTFVSNYRPWAAVYLKGTGPGI